MNIYISPIYIYIYRSRLNAVPPGHVLPHALKMKYQLWTCI